MPLRAYGTMSRRQADVWPRVARGLLNKTIAHELGMSEPAVKAVVSQLRRKTGAETRAGLVLTYLAHLEIDDLLAFVADHAPRAE